MKWIEVPVKFGCSPWLKVTTDGLLCFSNDAMPSWLDLSCLYSLQVYQIVLNLPTHGGKLNVFIFTETTVRNVVSAKVCRSLEMAPSVVSGKFFPLKFARIFNFSFSSRKKQQQVIEQYVLTAGGNFTFKSLPLRWKQGRTSNGSHFILSSKYFVLRYLMRVFRVIFRSPVSPAGSPLRPDPSSPFQFKSVPTYEMTFPELTVY